MENFTHIGQITYREPIVQLRKLYSVLHNDIKGKETQKRGEIYVYMCVCVCMGVYTYTHIYIGDSLCCKETLIQCCKAKYIPIKINF